MDKTGLIENVIKGTGTNYNVNIGYAVGGTFTLTVDSITTAPLAWNVTAANLRTALTAAGIATTTVTGSGTLAAPWVITFTRLNGHNRQTGLVENLISTTTTYK
jgi:hypothetical protein